MRASLRAIETSTDEEQKNTIAQKFSEKLKITTTAATLLLHDYIKSTADSTRAIEDDCWAADFSLSDFLRTYTDITDPLNPVEFEPVFIRNAPADTGQVVITVLFDDYMKLDKIATFINKLKLTDTELENILTSSAAIGCTDLVELPVTMSVADFDAFETLINLIKSRDQLPIGTPEYFDILNHAIETDDMAADGVKQAAKDLWLTETAARTNWEMETLEALVGTLVELNDAGMLQTNFPADFRNGDLVQRIKICLNTLNKIGLSTSLIEDAIQEDVDAELSQAIKNAAKAKYDEPQWLKIAKPLRDELREKQREALVAFIVARPDSSRHERWKNSDELYEYLLIDIEMKPISMTSRIKQATCSVQLFIDRVLMNLEHPNSDLTQTALKLEGDQVEEWKEWRKLYRVWEANRKIFLYPENWLEPELRDDKSPFFKELEAQLKQNELTDENVEDAFHNYLEKLDEVARLEVVGMYHQVETPSDEDAIDILHVFARTCVNPHKYYHRILEDGEWTSWIKLEIDVDGNHIVPVIFNRRLCLFWLFFTQENEESDSLNPNASSIDSPARYWKIQVAWSEFKKNKWTAKKISANYVESEHLADVPAHLDIKKHLVLRHEIRDYKLNLYLHSSDGSFVHEGETIYTPAFIFEDTGNDPEVSDEFLLTDFSLILPDSTDNIEMMVKAEDTEQALTINYRKTAYNAGGGWYGYIDDITVLNDCKEKKFKLVLPAAEYEPYGAHFFFQDAKNTFYVEHSMVSVPILTDPGFGFGHWQSGLIDVWGDMIQVDPIIPDPIGPVTDPDEFFADPVPDYGGFDFITGNGHVFNNNNIGAGVGNVLPGLIAGESAAQPVMMRAVTAGDARVSIKDLSAQSYGNVSLYDAGAVVWNRYQLKDRYTFHTFYHAHVKTFIKELYKFGVEGLLKRTVQTQDDTIGFDDSYDPTSNVALPYPTNEVDFEYGGAYAQYNWELFFHVPMLIACRLSADQRFEEAREWFHYIFDPTSSEGGDVERFWQFKPFYDEAGATIETLDELLRNEAELEVQVAKWMDNPFMPHVIARMRISAYMKNVVMKYLDNLIAWADNLFRRDTIESINEATNLYILSAKILGERPQEIPPRAEHADTDFDEIKDELDAFSNALIEIETMISPSTSSDGTEPSGSSNALGEMFYFCVPRNEYLMKYWDTVADRLFKIRQSMNIEGIVRTLPLFEPPIDPGILVRAAAAGMDLSSILSDLNAPLPHYRFAFMLQKANEVAGEVRGLGSALLQALEKRDAEAMSLLRSGHEQKVLKAVLNVKEKQVDDAKELLESVKKSLEMATLKFQYYSSRAFTNSYETQHLTSMQIGMVLSAVQGGLNTIAGVLSVVPNFKIGAPTSMGATFGGHNLGAMMTAVSNYLGIIAGINTAQGAMASTLGSYTRRMDDWKFQSSSASKEIQQLERQVISSEIKLAIGEKDLSNQQLQIDNAAETDEFMHSKFSNQQLYEWMIGQLSTVYFQSYQLAYDMAKKAEQCYQYELGQYGETSFIQFGYWDSLKKGLLSAEKLQYDLRRMEMSFYEENTREFELTKNISLLLLNPQAMLDLRANGKCTLTIPEALYDLDYQGHYFRRLKSVSLSIPCIAGPYTTINCTLRLTRHTTRLNTGGAGYSSADYSADDRFRHITTEIRSVATSNAQNDSGIFELSFRDERYLPFEGCGAFGEWEILLNENENLRLFDYSTISDVIMQVKYTAREDAGLFKTAVTDYLAALIEATVAPTATSDGIQLWRMFSSRHEFSGEWYKLFHPSDGTTQIMQFEIAQSRFPFFTQNRELQIKAVHVYGFFNNTDDYTVVITSASGIGTAQTLELNAGNNYHDSNDVSGVAFELGNFTLTVSKGIAPAALAPASESDVKDLILVLEYQCVS